MAILNSTLYEKSCISYYNNIIKISPYGRNDKFCIFETVVESSFILFHGSAVT
jgi:hypothetical protein